MFGAMKRVPRRNTAVHGERIVPKAEGNEREKELRTKRTGATDNDRTRYGQQTLNYSRRNKIWALHFVELGTGKSIVTTLARMEALAEAYRLQCMKKTFSMVFAYHFIYFRLSFVKLQIGYNIFTGRKFPRHFHEVGHYSRIQPINIQY